MQLSANNVAVNIVYETQLIDFVRGIFRYASHVIVLHELANWPWPTWMLNFDVLLFITDPFADANKGADEGVQDGLVHIRIQQRNGRKTLTTVQGLSSEYDLKKIVRACKKVRYID